ncbi:MAG TPA: LacI family DNA-binding transcriptional regulator [Solirubrobacteraceae bacterium]
MNAMPPRRPTMKDVASVAGVSIATVSRVVNGGDVRDDLALRVHDAIAVLGYRRDLTASTLRRADRQSGSLGLVFGDVSNPFFSAVHRGVEDFARGHGALTFAGSSDEDPERERELVEAFAARGVDGLVIVPCSRDQSYLQRERRSGTALVFVDRPPRFIDADAVLTDNVGGARAAVEHLIAAGHRRIAFLGDRSSIFTAAERRRGYREALDRAGLPHDRALERPGLGDSDAAGAAARELLLGPKAPTAVFAGQNLITVGVVRTLRDLGLQHRVGLVGFDDVVLGDVVEPGITVVTQDPYALGRRAAELLFARLGGDDGDTRRVELPTRLVPRGSGEIAPDGVVEQATERGA